MHVDISKIVYALLIYYFEHNYLGFWGKSGLIISKVHLRTDEYVHI